MRTSIKLRSGATIPAVDISTAKKKNYLSRSDLGVLHLMAQGDPVAFTENADGTVKYYFDAASIVEAPPETWFAGPSEKLTLPSGSVISKMGTRRAASQGFYTKERLAQMNYETIEEPVAYQMRNGEEVYFYDKRTALRLPLMCTKCGSDIRFRRKLCRKCYEEDLEVRRIQGDRHREAFYGMKRERVLFFDLELTGFYDRDEIISISMVDGTGRIVMNTLVKPTHTKRWKRTEKIHGITPDMVAESPTLEELIPEIKRIFENSDRIIAYGISTDFSHIKTIYETEAEQNVLHDKIRCCANEFVRYIHEHLPEQVHASLTDAMECLKIEWEGVAHSSMADTLACRKVWSALFPNYYED